MGNIEVTRHHIRTVRDISGKVVREEYYYTVSSRFLFFFRRHLSVYPVRNWPHTFITDILESKDVWFEWTIVPSFATMFDEEDAHRVLLDITQRPYRYIYKKFNVPFCPR